jgi:hypothetical protein
MGQHCYICNSSGKLGRCLASQLFALLRLIQLSLRNDSIVFGLKHINKQNGFGPFTHTRTLFLRLV